MPSLNHLYHIFHLRRRPDGFSALATSHVLRSLVSGVLQMFGVLYIFQLSGDLLTGVWWVVVFFGLQRVVIAVTLPLIAGAYSRIGYRWMMLFGLLSLATSAGFLSLVEQNFNFLWPALISGALATSGYYLGFHALFLDDNVDIKIGEQMGLLTLIERLALIVAPFLSGLIIERFNFSTLFLTVAIILIFAAIPLFLMPHHHRHRGKYSFSQALTMIKKQRVFTGSVWLWYVQEGIQLYLWPIFLVIILNDYSNFGAITSLAMIGNGFAIYAAGRIYDRRPLHRVFPFMGGTVAITWIMRFLATTSFSVATADVLNRLVSPGWWMKIRRHALAVGEKTDSLVFGVSWELLSGIGIIIGLIVGYSLLVISNGQWLWLVLPTVLGVAMSTWVIRRE